MKQINLIYGSEHGSTEQLACDVAKHLQGLGYVMVLFADPQACDVSYLTEDDVLWVLTSTTGAGEIPENLRAWYDMIVQTQPNLDHLETVVIGIGDSNYAETYCDAGRQIYELLESRGACLTQPLYQVDMSVTVDPKTTLLEWIASWLKE
jgi:flavodoxin